MSVNDPFEWSLIDNDLETKLAILPSARSHLYFVLNEPGSGSLDIPIDSGSAELVSSGMLARSNYRGSQRGAFFIDNIKKNFAEEGNLDGGQWLSISGRGEMAILEDAIIYPDTPSITKRIFTGTKAGVIILLIDEAIARGAILPVTYNFTDILDSDGETWTDNDPIELNVGATLLDTVRLFAKLGIDFKMSYDNGDFILSAYKLGIGSDKSNTIFFRIGKNCEVFGSDQRGNDTKNSLLLSYRDGFTSVENSPSITLNRRREKLIDLKEAQSASSALTYGSAILDGSKDPKRAITLKIYDGVSPILFEDYGMGDIVSIDNKGVEENHRILGIQCDWDGRKYTNVVLELNNLLYENEIKIAQDLNNLLNNWNTARDANQLEMQDWFPFGDPNIEYSVVKSLIVGDIWYGLSGYNLLIYDIANGHWRSVLSPSPLQCITFIGTDIYLGASFAVLKFDTLTDIFTNIGIVSNAGPDDDYIASIVALGTNIYCGGAFDTIDSVSMMGMAKYDTLTDTWTDVGGGSTFIRHLITDGSNIYGVAGEVRKWDTTTWSDVGTFPISTSGVNSLKLYGSGLIAGASNGSLYYWDTSSWSLYGPDLGGSIVDIGIYLTDIYVVGFFTDVGNRAAVLKGGSWYPLGDGLNNTAYTISMDDQNVYVGGVFTEAGNKEALGVAVWINGFEEVLEHISKTNTFDLAAAIHSATSKSPLVGNDEFGFWDSVSKKLRKINFSNFLVSIKALLSYTANRILITTSTGILGVTDKLFFNDTYGHWIHGAITAAFAVTTLDNSEHQVGIDAASVGKFQYVWSDTLDHSPFETGVRGGGTKASPTKVLEDMVLRKYRARGYLDNSNTISNTAAEIRLVADADWSGTSSPTRIEFWTTPAGSLTLTRAYYIGSDQILYDDSGTPIGSGGGGTWGSITGTLSDQTDLQTELDNKQDVSGWIEASGTWNYSSTDDPTGVITSNVDETGEIGVADYIKFVNGGNTIYGIITEIAFAAGTTTIKFCHQIDPTDNLALVLVAASAITLPHFSHVANPYGFPASEESWRILIKDTSNRSQASPGTTIYNLGSLSINVPIGAWELSSFSLSEAEVNLAAVQARSVRTGLSTANNTFSDLEMYVMVFLTTPISTTATVRAGIMLSKLLVLTAKTTYYLNCGAGGATAPTHIAFRGDLATTRIMAKLTYFKGG